MSKRQINRVKWFNSETGYGFIVNDAGQDLFVHYRSIQVEGYKTLKEGQLVEYLEVKSEKGLQAHEVVPLDTEPTDTHPPE